MFFKKPEPVVTISLFSVVTTSISAIWIFNKLVSVFRNATTNKHKNKLQHYQSNKCHCHLWHSTNCDHVKVGWHKNDDIRWEQNYEISRAFLSIEAAVEQLSRSGFPRAISGEQILQNALIALNASEHTYIFMSNEGYCTREAELEHLFVARSLKNAWPLLAPKAVPSRHYVDMFCQNLEEKKNDFYSLLKEYQALLEYLQYIKHTHAYTQRIVSVIKNYYPVISSRDLLLLQGPTKMVENFIKHSSELNDVKAKSARALYLLEQEGIKRIIAIDAEMVGAGEKGQINMIGRVSLVNQFGCIYDKYVKPVKRVTDYRTFVSGIRPEDLTNAVSFYVVQREVRELIKYCILVGHDLEKDLDVLGLSHPAKDIRDTAFFVHFRKVPNEKPSLEYLARCKLGRTIQNGEHDSVEDARAAMDIFLTIGTYEWDWREELSSKLNMNYINPNERIQSIQETNRFLPEA